MDARHEVKRLRRDADRHEYQAIELRARAKALESRDAIYRQAMEDGGHPIRDSIGLFQRARLIVVRLRGETI